MFASDLPVSASLNSTKIKFIPMLHVPMFSHAGVDEGGGGGERSGGATLRIRQPKKSLLWKIIRKPFFIPQTSKKLTGHIGFGLSVRTCVGACIRSKHACHIL